MALLRRTFKPVNIQQRPLLCWSVMPVLRMSTEKCVLAPVVFTTGRMASLRKLPLLTTLWRARSAELPA